MDKHSMNFDIFDYSKRISLEIGVPFQLKLTDVAYPLQSVLVGMEINEYLIIKIPSQFSNVKHKIFPGVEIIVRYIYQGIVFGFQTKLIDMIFKPVKLLFLEYPKIIEHHELRSHKRAQSIFPATIKIKDMVSNGAIIDISKNGCRCHILAASNDLLPTAQIDDEVLLTCKFPGLHGDHMVMGIIRNIERSRKDLIFGVEFKFIDEKINDHISSYLYSIEDFASYPLK
jgi:hypothetical protein